MKKAIVTGVTGQDGAYLAELLLNKGYEVYGTYRRTSSVNFWRIEELGIQNHKNFHLVEYDLTDQANSIHMVSKINPDEIYNFPSTACCKDNVFKVIGLKVFFTDGSGALNPTLS